MNFLSKLVPKPIGSLIKTLIAGANFWRTLNPPANYRAMSAASGEPLGCRPAYRVLCGNLGFLSAADDLSARRDELGPQFACLGVKLLLKLTHAGVESIVRRLHCRLSLKRFWWIGSMPERRGQQNEENIRCDRSGGSVARFNTSAITSAICAISL